MKKIKCPVRFWDETIHIDAYLAAPGLAVHRGAMQGGRIATQSGLSLVSKHWQITHIPTGRLLPIIESRCCNLVTRREASRLARCLAENLNWLTLGDMLPSYREHILPAIGQYLAGHDPAEKGEK